MFIWECCHQSMLFSAEKNNYAELAFISGVEFES